MAHLPPGFKEPDPLEKEIETDVKNFSKKLGWEAYKWTSTSNRGVLDDLFFHYHRIFIIIEFKRKGKDYSPKQKQVKDLLIGRGHPVFKVDNKQLGKEIIWIFTPEKYRKEKLNPFKK